MSKDQKYYVYFITNKIKPGELYIGFTNNYEKRCKEHKWRAKQSEKSSDFYLYRCIRKYHIDNFEFSIIEEFDNRIDALNAEEFFISYLRFYGAVLYNTQTGGTCSDGFKGRKHTTKSKDKIKNSLRDGGALLASSEVCRSLNDIQILDLRRDICSEIYTRKELMVNYDISYKVLSQVIKGTYKPMGSKVILNGELILPFMSATKILDVVSDLIKIDMYSGNFNALEIAEKFGVPTAYLYKIKDPMVKFKRTDNSGKNHPLFGIGHTEETKKILSDKAKQRASAVGYVAPQQGKMGELSTRFGIIGDKHPRSTITDTNVILFKNDLKSGIMSLAKLALKYNITYGVAYSISSGRTRKDII